jgi:hypothetical protein
MNFSEDQLALIEDYAACFMTWQQIAILLDVDEHKFKDELGDRNSPAWKRYSKGKTRTAYEINKNLVRLAKLGSPQADILVKTDMNRQEDAEDEL